MHVLSLCSGAGGLDLGLTLAEPSAWTVCFVERDAYAAAILVARMRDGCLDDAPIWDDVAAFDGRSWRGAVDCLTAGYPCQPFSVAGRRLGTDDPRHLWPHIARIIGECAPEWVFLENVANHLNIGYREVRGELEGLGFRVTEGLFTAREVGAPHRRQRLFVLAHAERGRRRQPAENTDPQGQPLRSPQRQEGASGPGPGGPDVADATSVLGQAFQRMQPDGTRAGMGDAKGLRRREAERGQAPERGPDLSGEGLDGGLPPCGPKPPAFAEPDPAGEGRSGDGPAFPPGPDDGDGWKRYLRFRPDAQPAVRRGSDGLANRVDRLRLCGNGVVPLVAAHAWRTLSSRFDAEGG